MEVKLMIDGEEVPLETERTMQIPVGKTAKREYELWGVKNPYKGLWPFGPIFGTIYKKPGWKPSQGLASPMPADVSTSRGRDTKILRSELPKELESFDFFLKHSSDGKGPKTQATRRSYLYAIETFQRYLGQRAPTPELAKEFIVDLKKTNSPSTLNVHIAALTSYFRFLGQELIIPRFKTYKDYPPTLSGHEWQKLLEIASSPLYDPNLSNTGRFLALRELCVLCVYCDCGLRPFEAIGLKVEDVLDEGYFQVKHPDGTSEMVPVNGFTLKCTKDYLHYRNRGEPYLFPGEKHGTHIAHRTAEALVHRLFRRAELPDARARSLRYRTIQQLRKIGISGEDMKAQLESETFRKSAFN